MIANGVDGDPKRTVTLALWSSAGSDGNVSFWEFAKVDRTTEWGRLADWQLPTPLRPCRCRFRNAESGRRAVLLRQRDEPRVGRIKSASVKIKCPKVRFKIHMEPLAAGLFRPANRFHY